MPKSTTRKVPNHKQRVLMREKDKYTLLAAETRLSIPEWAEHERLKKEAGNPKNPTDRAAILERAKAHVRGQERADREAAKTIEQKRKELFGER